MLIAPFAQVLPVEAEVLRHQYTSADRWVTNHAAIEELKSQAKSAGLWNLFMPVSSSRHHGAGLTNLEYAPMAEEMGRSLIAAEVFNCSAPDTGNMGAWLQHSALRRPLRFAFWGLRLSSGERGHGAWSDPVC